MAENLELEVWKDGRLVATAQNARSVDLAMPEFPPATAFWIPLLDLERIVIFEHLAGAPLSRFLNSAGLRVRYMEDDQEIDEDQLEPVFYVHGRSETARGDITVSSVVLVWFDCDPSKLPSDRQLLPQMPAIYKEVSRLL